MKAIRYIIPFLIISLLLACKHDDSTKKDCTMGKPTAIFSDSMSFIKNHQFTVKNQESTETLVLPDDVTMQIDQAGCESINQRYIFTYPIELKLDSITMLVDSVIGKFNYLAGKNHRLKAFSLWSGALGQFKTQIHQNEQIELGNGILISVDKMNSFNKTSIYFECLQKSLSEE